MGWVFTWLSCNRGLRVVRQLDVLTEIQSEVDKALQIFIEGARNDFSIFARGLIIPSAYGPVMFDKCMADFQANCFDDVSPSLHAVRDGKMPPKRRFWIERTKKASKDADLAVMILWLIAFSKRPIKGQICASNSEQARIVENRVVELLHHNSWLNDFVEVIQCRIRSRERPREVWFHIEGSSTSSSAGEKQGEAPEVLILNELVHVERWAAMEAHMNNADGVPMGIVIVCTNAGIRGTKAEVWRDNAMRSDLWSCHILNEPSPWADEKLLEEARRRDPIGAEYSRLWEGRWISGTGGAVGEDDIEAAFRLKGPERLPSEGMIYIAGFDLGVAHDHAGVVVVGVSEIKQVIRVACVQGWAPSIPNDKGKLEVDLQEVEEVCWELTQLFRIGWFGYDPAAGGSFMAQRLRRRAVPMREMTFSSSNLTLMAEAYIQALKERKLECYEDREGRLRRDFGKFAVKARMPSGYKLEAVSDEYGHADVGTALVICLPKAMEMLGGRIGLQPGDSLSDEAEWEELTKEEIDVMDPALREIYEGASEEEEKLMVKRAWKDHRRNW